MSAATTAVHDALHPPLGDDTHARRLDAVQSALDRVGPWVERFFSPRASGLAHLHEGEGPALIVGNHSGGVLAMLEPLVLGHAIRAELGDAAVPRALVHEILWHTPLAPWLASVGAVRASQANARALLGEGHRVLVYPGGDREAFRPFVERDTVTLGGRHGYVRLALESGVPIVPVVSAGMHSGFISVTDGHALAQALMPSGLRVGVLPITLSFPFGLSIGVPAPYLPIDARVRIRALSPIRFTRRGAEAAADDAYVEACHRIVLRRMQAALDQLSIERRAERRQAIHGRLDGLFDRLERLTSPARAQNAAPHTTTPHTITPHGLRPPRPMRRAA